ncbi:MAG: putative glycoside hydrolase [Oscillospiraceae bacterium]
MAKNSKPVKIKRYKNSMGTNTQAVLLIKNIVFALVIAVIIIGVGYFFGKPVMNFIAGVGDKNKDNSTASSPSNSEVQSASKPPENSGDNSYDEGADNPVIGVKNRIYYFADNSLLTTQEGIMSVIKDMRSKGANHCVFTLKNEDGNVLYNSSNKYASQLKGTTIVDVGLVCKLMGENSITPVAQVYTFMDKMISTLERKTAVLYQGTEARWLDSSAALGGKAWANPASDIERQYLVDLTDEIISLGVKEFIFAGYSTPTGFSLDKRDFGASQEQVLAHMKNLIGTLQGRIAAKGGYSSWQYDYEAVKNGGNYAQYIIHPYQLGAGNVIITAKGYEGDVKAAVEEINSAQAGGSIDSATLWLTDGDFNGDTKPLGSYFVK